MISTLIFLGFLIAAVLVAIKTKDKMFVTTQTRYGNENNFQPMWLVKPIGLFLVGIILASVQPYAIEKIDAGHKGLKINLIGDQRGVSSYQYKTGWVVYNSWTEQVLEFPTCLLYTSPSPRDRQKSRMPSSA